MTSTLARLAYSTLEPYHVAAYFNPDLPNAYADTGLDGHAFYVGARGAPLGPCAPAVVASTFYNFSPALVATAWPAAVEVGLERVSDRRWAALDTVLADALGERAGDPQLADLARRLHEIGDRADFAGRPLSAAWHASSHPDAPHLALWHAIAVLREWRGDGHLAALVDAELDPTEAVVFHEAEHPDPAGRRTLGRRITQITRGWSDEQWGAAIDGLRTRGLLQPDAEALSDNGVELDRRIEERTDRLASSIWRDVPDAEGLLTSARPYVKAVIAAGFLPGTTKKA
ncbi:SCO6745 family protein [Rhodococcoides corynebacterioides]|uniref:SalK n=1 Tax=Rhodococcoides corynebacterioides TaxID=53972 RepID=A0ABS7P2D4_9NOCA|nr:hypothetical protein [Rhodococcus corynebacterioides]MBY6366571.1 hypothetical protein [Rhodococcus corynebacterioides]MBY6408060.1 hypothetical protein [Rhodococcus corynebacterioides]